MPEIEFDYRKLKGRIIEKYETLGKFSNKIGVSQCTLSKKLHNKVGFSPKEICKYCENLEIADSEIGEYFFTTKVR